MSVFVLVPTLFLVLLAVSNASLYRFGAFSFSLANLQIFTQSIIVQSLKNSFFYALIVSLVSFLVGYPVAYTLTKLLENTKRILIALMILPLWTNMLVQNYRLGTNIFGKFNLHRTSLVFPSRSSVRNWRSFSGFWRCICHS
ncbi:MAG: hypothetical protein MZU97_04135 [Bacillus subtilis]|nr:hypothetical protein [Bacillus subtilis]